MKEHKARTRILISPAKAATVKSEACIEWCAEHVHGYVVGQQNGADFWLYFEHADEAEHFQLTWL